MVCGKHGQPHRAGTAGNIRRAHHGQGGLGQAVQGLEFYAKPFLKIIITPRRNPAGHYQFHRIVRVIRQGRAIVEDRGQRQEQ